MGQPTSLPAKLSKTNQSSQPNQPRSNPENKAKENHTTPPNTKQLITKPSKTLGTQHQPHRTRSQAPDPSDHDGGKARQHRGLPGVLLLIRQRFRVRQLLLQPPLVPPTATARSSGRAVERSGGGVGRGGGSGGYFKTSGLTMGARCVLWFCFEKDTTGTEPLGNRLEQGLWANLKTRAPRQEASPREAVCQERVKPF